MTDMPTPRSTLDAEELKHLALKAMATGRDDDAIRWLKDALALAPQQAELHHLLGMAHSHIGMVERAADEIAHALELDPGLINARFQLGLLQFIRHDHERARAVWEPLHGMLDAQHPLRLFVTGMTQLGLGEVEASIATLEQGAARCDNARLNQDMLGIADAARRHLAAEAHGGPANGRDASVEAPSPHLLLSRYEQSRGSQD